MKGTTQMDRLMQLPEVATATTLSESTLRYLRHQGKGPRATKLGRRLVYREVDVQAWLDESFAQGERAAG